MKWRYEEEPQNLKEYILICYHNVFQLTCNHCEYNNSSESSSLGFCNYYNRVINGRTFSCLEEKRKKYKI